MEYSGNYAYFFLKSGGKCRIFVLETKCVPKTKKANLRWSWDYPYSD